MELKSHAKGSIIAHWSALCCPSADFLVGLTNKGAKHRLLDTLGLAGLAWLGLALAGLAGVASVSALAG